MANWNTKTPISPHQRCASFFQAEMNVTVGLFSIRSTTQKENLGIIVQYKVKVKIIVAMGG